MSMWVKGIDFAPGDTVFIPDVGKCLVRAATPNQVDVLTGDGEYQTFPHSAVESVEVEI